MGSLKGQKHKKYSPELKKEILDRYYNNFESSLALEEKYGISHKTIENWITKTNNGKDVIIDKRPVLSGRKKELTIEEVLQENEILKKILEFSTQQREKKLSSSIDSETNTH